MSRNPLSHLSTEDHPVNRKPEHQDAGLRECETVVRRSRIQTTILTMCEPCEWMDPIRANPWEHIRDGSSVRKSLLQLLCPTQAGRDIHQPCRRPLPNNQEPIVA